MTQPLLAGQSYVGTFAESDGNNFFFRDDQNRVLVGQLKEATLFRSNAFLV